MLQGKHITFSYSDSAKGKIDVLKDVSFEIREHDFIGLIGTSGSGKTTLIKHLNGLLKAESGEIFFNGENIYSKKYPISKLRKEVGLVFQYPEHQLFENDVLSDVCFGPMNQGLSREEAEVEAKKALQHVGFKEKNYSKSPFELSGGQKIRGITIILVSHSMEDIAKYAERLIVVNDGEIAYDDAPKAVFAHYRELEAMGLAAPQITYIMHALKEKGLDVDVTATTVDEAKENILAVLRKCNPGKLSGDRQSVSDSQSKKENAKAETLISEMEADLTEDGTKESHSDAPDEDLSIQKETMDKKSAEQEENEGGQEV